MRKCLCSKNLWSTCSRAARPASRRSGFSLAELVVSIGILVLMMALAGQVFNLAIDSTGQATALTTVSQLVRAFEETLREDLRHVQPGRSLIMIQGNPVNAYWTQRGKDADDDKDPSSGYAHPGDPARERMNDATGRMEMVLPRADMLSFFAARKATTHAHAQAHPGLAASLQWVTYGHAELGKYVRDPAGGYYPIQLPAKTAFPVENDYPSPTKRSLVPAEQWHLARRGILLVPTETPTPVNLPMTLATFSTLLSSESDVIGRFSYEQNVLKPGVAWPWFLPDIIDPGNPVPRSVLDPAPPAPMARRLGHYLLANCASFKVEWTLDPYSEFVAGRLDGAGTVLWFDPGHLDEPNKFSEHPLAELQAVAGDPVRDPDGKLASLLAGTVIHSDGLEYSLAHRFLGPDITSDANRGWPTLAPDKRPNLVVFGAARRHVGPDLLFGTPDDPIVQEDVFPSALRITIDVYDSQRRLDRPTRHVMVVPVGG